MEEVCSRETATPSEESADTDKAKRGVIEGWTDSESPASTPLRRNIAPPPLGQHPQNANTALPAPTATPVAAKSAKREAAEALLAARHVSSTATATAIAGQGSSFRLASFAAHSSACGHSVAEESQYDSTHSTPHASQPGRMSVGKHSAKVQRRKLNPTVAAAHPSSEGALQPQCMATYSGVEATSSGFTVVPSVQQAAQYLWAAATATITRKPERLVRACADSAACCSSAHSAEAPPAVTAAGAWIPY